MDRSTVEEVTDLGGSDKEADRSYWGRDSPRIRKDTDPAIRGGRSECFSVEFKNFLEVLSVTPLKASPSLGPSIFVELELPLSDVSTPFLRSFTRRWNLASRLRGKKP